MSDFAVRFRIGLLHSKSLPCRENETLKSDEFLGAKEANSV
jgi:hypothetical protein